MNPATAVATAIFLASTAFPVAAMADSADARCDIYPAGSDQIDKMIACTFSQRQGYITIYREDGVTHDLSPVGDAPGNFRDQEGRPVYRQGGLGDQGLIFRFENESVYLERLQVFGRAFEWEAQGILNFDGRGDLEIKKGATVLAMRGTVDDTTIKVLPVSALTAPIDRLFRDRIDER